MDGLVHPQVPDAGAGYLSSGRLERTVLLGLAIAALLVLVGVGNGVRLPASLLVLTWGCGWLAARRLLDGESAALAITLGAALAPAVSGGVAALLAWAGMGLPSAARLIVGVTGLWALAEAFLPLPSRPPAPARSVHLYGPALLWTGAVALLLAGNPFLIEFSDAWFHGAVVERVTQLGVPPEDPFFAGIPLLYFWGYHVWAALVLSLVPGLWVFAPLLVYNLLAAAAVMTGLCLLVFRLGGGPSLAWLTCGLAALGYDPGAWVWPLLRSFTGQVKGGEEISRLLAPGSHPLMQAMRFGTMHSSLVSFSDKFIVLTPFSMAAALFVLFLIAWLRLIERPTARRAAVLGMVQAASLFLHSLAGWAQALAAGLAWWWLLLGSRDGRESRAALLPILLAFTGAFLLLLPYLIETTFGKMGTLRFGMTALALTSLILAGALYVPTGWATLVSWGRSRVAGRELAPLGLGLSLAALLVQLPESNQSKFLNLLFLLLAAPAAWGWQWFWRHMARGARVILVAAAVTAVGPTVVLVAWAKLHESGGAGLVPRSSAAERAAFRWAQRSTSPKTVFADQEGGQDLVVLAGRGVIWGGPGYENNWGYPATEVRLRERAVRELAAGDTLDAGVRALLRRLNRPIVVVERRRYQRPGLVGRWSDPDPSRGGWTLRRAGERYRLLFANREVRFYRWEGGQ